MSYEIVIPTSGRDSLAALLDAIGPEGVIVVDDRRDRAQPLPLGAASRAARRRGADAPALRRRAARPPRATRAGAPPVASGSCSSTTTSCRRPAGARRWRPTWPRPAPTWPRPRAASSSPSPLRPTDWERNVAGLEHARWATADMAYRRDVLAAVGGFDERFPRAYREDADLGLRVTGAGWRIVEGGRHVVHPVRPASPWISITKQAGNADDVLMRRLHGRDWRERAGVPRGRRPRHLATAAAGLGAVVAAAIAAHAQAGAAPQRRFAAGVLGAGWLAGTAELAWARIAPGPRTPREVATMVATSVLMPFAAVAWSLRGLAGAPGRRPRPRPAAVLFDRDGTLIADVPYNGDPARVEPMPGAREALARLRAAGVPVAVVSNQSGIARGLLAHEDVRAIHARMEELLGPLGPLEYCPHGPDDGCACRKPAPGPDPARRRAPRRRPARLRRRRRHRRRRRGGPRGGSAAPCWCPTPRTRAEEIDAAPRRARDLTEAIDLLVPA